MALSKFAGKRRLEIQLDLDCVQPIVLNEDSQVIVVKIGPNFDFHKIKEILNDDLTDSELRKLHELWCDDDFGKRGFELLSDGTLRIYTI
jgi:hypothetical protein